MKQQQVVDLLSALGGKVTAKTKNWVTCRCLFAPFNHDGGVDNHPSSGMSVKVGESKYNCFSCGEGGTAYEVYKKLKFLYAGEIPPTVDFKKAMGVIDSDDFDEDLDFPDYEEEINKEPLIATPFDEALFHKFPTAYAHPYVVVRGISEALAKEIDIRLDFDKCRILFPIRDWNGVLMGIHGRTFLEDVEPRYYSYPCNGKRNPQVWMGEDHVDLDEPLILTEGQFDYAKVRVHYDNVLSGQTTQVSEDKIKRIAGAGEIITMFDQGVGGDKGRDRISDFFPNQPVTHLVPPPQYGDLGNMPDREVYKLLELIA
jgi:hypothetical protein